MHENGADMYKVTLSSDGAYVNRTTVQSNNATFTGLTPGNRYDAAVIAVNVNGTESDEVKSNSPGGTGNFRCNKCCVDSYILVWNLRNFFALVS